MPEMKEAQGQRRTGCKGLGSLVANGLLKMAKSNKKKKKKKNMTINEVQRNSQFEASPISLLHVH